MRDKAVLIEAKMVQVALKDLGAKVTAQEIKIELAADVLFDGDVDSENDVFRINRCAAGAPSTPWCWRSRC